jgi:NDP-sugar pyrophosphorylase family protein
LESIPIGFSDFAKDIFPRLLEKRKNLFAYYPKCYFKEVGQLQRYEIAKKEIESEEVKLNL